VAGVIAGLRKFGEILSGQHACGVTSSCPHACYSYHLPVCSRSRSRNQRRARGSSMAGVSEDDEKWTEVRSPAVACAEAEASS
jgi:hypothetical protein